MPRTLYLAWQHPRSRRWVPIGRLDKQGEEFLFRYTRGVLEAQEMGYQPEMSFPDVEREYRSIELFPFFANRVIGKSRMDYPLFLERLNLPENTEDPMLLLGRSGGRRTTDAFELFSYPERDEVGSLSFHFFAHGIRHLPPPNRSRIRKLEEGEQLLMMRDFQNEVDENAVALRSEDMFLLGYCPRYLTGDLQRLVGSDQHRTRVFLERVNLPPAPAQLRLLCKLVAPWPAAYEPFSGPEYQIMTAAGSPLSGMQQPA